MKGQAKLKSFSHCLEKAELASACGAVTTAFHRLGNTKIQVSCISFSATLSYGRVSFTMPKQFQLESQLSAIQLNATFSTATTASATVHNASIYLGQLRYRPKPGSSFASSSKIGIFFMPVHRIICDFAFALWTNILNSSVIDHKQIHLEESK